MPNQNSTNAVSNNTCSDGEPMAFDQIFTHHYPMVRSVAKRFARRPADVEDLCQEIFLKVFRSLKTFRGDSQLSTWIYRISLNTAISYTKANVHNELTNTDFIEEESMADPERICAAQEDKRVLDCAIESLAPALRDAMLLNSMGGLDYAAVGRLLNCPVGTVRSRISRARANVAAALAA